MPGLFSDDAHDACANSRIIERKTFLTVILKKPNILKLYGL